MRYLVSIFIFSLLANFSFSQDTTRDPNSGYPYYQKTKIWGTEFDVLKESFAGSSDTSQIIFRSIFGSPIFPDIFTIYVCDNDSLLKFSTEKVIKPGQQVFLFYGNLHGEAVVRPGEGIWSVLQRILRTPPIRAEMSGEVVSVKVIMEEEGEKQQSIPWWKRVRDGVIFGAVILFIYGLVRLIF